MKVSIWSVGLLVGVMGCVSDDAGTTPGARDATVPDASMDAAGHDAAADSGQGSLDATVGEDGSVCLPISIDAYDTSCATTSDCAAVFAGDMCEGLCTSHCANAVISKAELPRYQDAFEAALASLPPTLCLGCPILGNPTCVLGKCTFAPVSLP